MRRCFYGVNIIAFGAWEACAFATGQVPTVTTTVRAARERFGFAADAAIAAWLTGLAVHLYRN